MPRYLLDGVSGERMFPLAAAAAINAGIEFLGNAGKGREIPLDESLRCFLFEQAEGGPLGTLKVIGELTGGTVLPETVRAFDLFGNELSGRILKLSGPLVYLRFPAGSDAEKILRSLRFTGLGDPVSIQLSMSGRHSLLLRCRNRRADSLKAEIRFVGLPSGITVEPAAMTVELAPGAERQETIALAGGAVGEKCRFKVQVKTGEGTVTQEFSFAPIFVHYSRTLSFENVPFLSLAGDHLSCPFTPGLTWKGREDLCARFAAVWNEHGLKLRIEVDDDHFVQPYTGLKTWNGDSIQCGFAKAVELPPGVNELEYLMTQAYSEIDYALTTAGKEAYRTISFDRKNLPEGAISDKDAPFQITRELLPDGRSRLHYRIALPWRFLNIAEPSAGMKVYWASTVNDRDDIKQKDVSAIGAFQLKHQAPQYFGSIQLVQ